MTLSEEQISFIREDILSRGITMEGLQDDLLDHICCLLEDHPGGANDFEKVYREILQTFYKKELKEIETETLSLINQKTIAMKKSMLTTGLFAAGLLSLGIVLKFIHAPGASAAIVSGTFLFSLVFLPLLALIRMGEKKVAKEKLLVALGVLSAMLMSLSFVFRVQHWPGAMVMLYLCIGILLLLFLPFYLAGGFKKPETKAQTLVVSILLVAGCGLWLTLVASPSGVRRDEAKNMQVYRLSEQILKTEQSQVEKLKSATPVTSAKVDKERALYDRCESLKASILVFATRSNTPANDLLREEWLNSFLAEHPEAQQLLNDISTAASAYNRTLASAGGLNPLPEQIFHGMENEKTVEALNGIMQVQMILLQNQGALLADGK